jgi:chromosome segregation ATPase
MELEAEIHDQMRQNNSKTDKIKELEAELEKYTQLAVSNESKVNDLDRELTTKAGELDALRVDVADLTQQLCKSKDEVGDFKVLDRMTEELSTQEREIDRLRAELSSRDKDMALCDTIICESEARAQQLEQKVQALEEGMKVCHRICVDMLTRSHAG